MRPRISAVPAVARKSVSGRSPKDRKKKDDKDDRDEHADPHSSFEDALDCRTAGSGKRSGNHNTQYCRLSHSHRDPPGTHAVRGLFERRPSSRIALAFARRPRGAVRWTLFSVSAPGGR